MMTVGALHTQESVLQPSAFEVIRKFLLHMQGQGLALHGHHIPELRIMPLDDLIEKCLFRSTPSLLNENRYVPFCSLPALYCGE